MRAMILALDTEVPENVLSQECFSDTTARLFGFTDSQESFLKRITSRSRIQKRYTVVDDFLEGKRNKGFFGSGDPEEFPKTSKRNELYKEFAPKLAESVCHRVLEQWGGERSAITHVISVSCTGMIAPGIEFLLLDRLGLSFEVDRLGINFMGCFGAFKGLSIAKALALEDPRNRVLVVCTELCSLHFQRDLNIDTMVANSIFADGAAAIVVGAEPREGEKPSLEIHNQKSVALNNTLDLMTWEAGDYGYQMRLSASVSAHLENSISPFAQRLTGENLPFKKCTWAVHPGGKTILESITKGCDLQKEQLEASWKVLNDYGNMSSPTFLFVLKEVLKHPCPRKWVVGLGFGPGLSIEGLLLKRVDENVAK